MHLHDIVDGTTVFIDANIFVYHFTANSRFNRSCTDFLARAEVGAIRGITSAMMVLEAIHRLMVEEAVLAFPDLKPKDIVKHLKTHPDDAKKLIVHRAVPSKISQLSIEIIPVGIKTIESSQQIKSEYGFLSNDALMLQVVKDNGLAYLASNDSDFERIGFITLCKPA